MNTTQNICKICHVGDTEEEKLCNPCKCSGSIKYIHKDCLFMYIKSSNKTFCSICKFNYVFKDIYRENTPKYLPLTLLIKEIASRAIRFTKIIARIISLFLIVALILVINSFVVYEMFGFTYTEFAQSNLYAVGFIGAVVSLISFSIYYLYQKVSNNTRLRNQRRNLRIDSLSVMSSMASEAMSSAESQNTLLSNIAFQRDDSFLSHRNINSTLFSVQDDSNLINFSRNRTNNLNSAISREINSRNTEFVEDENYEHLSSEVSDEIVRENVTQIVIDFKLIYKCCNVIFILSIFSKILKFVKFDFPKSKFTTFLDDVFLADFTKYIVVSYALFFVTMLAVCNYKTIYNFFRILNLIFLFLVFIVYMDGLAIHFIFARFINQGIVIDFQKYHFRAFYSTLFHIALGYSFNLFLRNFIWMFKAKFREGVIWPLADPENGSFMFFFKLSKRSLRCIYTKAFKNFIVHIGAYAIFLNILKTELTRKFFIKDATKLFIIFKMFNMMSSTFDSTLMTIVNINHVIIRFCAKFLKMNNFLFNEEIPIENISKDRLRWLPNKNKFYEIEVVDKICKRKVTDENIEKYYCKETTRNFSIFYVPKYFRFYISIMLLLVTVNSSLAFKLIFRITKLITEFIESRYSSFVKYDDYLFIFISGVVMFFSFSIQNALKIVNHLKFAILNLYLNILWPMWGTFMMILLYGNESMNIIPSQMFLIFFATSDILRSVFLKFLFEGILANYSFRSILTRLYSFTVSTTLVFCTVRYLKTWLIFTFTNTTGIPYFYVISAIAICLYYSGCINRLISNFVDNIRREHYLVDREILNCE